MSLQRTLLPTLALALALLAAPAALASTVQISSSNRISVNGEGSERNAVSVSYDAAGDLYRITDSAGIDALGACADVDATSATCPGATVVAVTVKTGAGTDLISLDPATMPASTEGSLDGGTGRDTVLGGRAGDSLIGGSDADILDGGAGGDEMRGGGGRDIASYVSRTAGVTVSIGSGDADDGDATDQSGGGRDTVRGDVEEVITGPGPDTIVGDGSRETLIGGEGDDLIAGGAGDDELLGAWGNDLLSGDSGDDVLRGGDGDDRHRGGNGNDLLAGGLGADILKGQRGVDAMKGKSGIDRILARDGTRDAVINCGRGRNRLERVKRDRGKRRKRNNDPKPRSC